ncbi:hypothetical protein [Segatella oulorum]|uniref:hypothetical protein n=1 Tax=Segatella oulorum TaxID=28136 RepID=UPI0012DD0257|nr:hypothetical protein [Segatella oulorum]
MNTPRGLVEMGRGGACVPARVAPQGCIRRSFPAHHACIFGMETPLRGRSGGHTGAAPTVSFGQITCGWLISFGWIACGTVDFVWADCMWVVDVVWVNYARGRLVAFGWIARKWLFCLCGLRGKI